jgi:hypothetical protein
MEFAENTIRMTNERIRKEPKGRNQFETQTNIAIILRLKQTILDLSPKQSEYWSFANSIKPPLHSGLIYQLVGALKSLRDNYANDFFKSFNEMVDAELFTDILLQAEYLLSESYFRASAVVARVALESHLRKLAEKNSIPITTDDGKYLKADSLNGELLRNKIIDKNFNKNVKSWLDTRNNAAHPGPKEVNMGLIAPMIAGIRVFIEK